MLFIEIIDGPQQRPTLLNVDAVLMVVPDDKGNAQVITFACAAVSVGMPYQKLRTAILDAQADEELEGIESA